MSGLLDTDIEVDSQQSTSPAQTSTRIWLETLWLSALFVYSSVSEVTLKLFDCREIGGESLLYYATSYRCFSGHHRLQYLSYVLGAAVLCFPIAVVIHGFKHRFKGSLVFKDDFWWWEGVLMTRRLVLIGLSVLPIALIERQTLLACVSLLIVVTHLQCQPFMDSNVNRCETILLFCLALISILSMLEQQVCCLMAAHHYSLATKVSLMTGEQ